MNPGNSGLRRLWLAPLANKLVEESSTKKKTLLDYGCGHFDLASMVSEKYELTGYDIFPYSPLITTDLSSLAGSKFDLIVASSVLQYFDDRQLSLFLTFCSDHLEKNGKVILSDLIPENYHSIRDLLFSLSFAAKNNSFSSMAYHLLKSMLRISRRPLKRWSYSKLQNLALEHGLSLEILPGNLTLSPFRWSCELKFLAS